MGIPVLAIVGLVVTVRAFWRAVTGASGDAAPEARVLCGACGKWNPRSRHRCAGCGGLLRSGETVEAADRSAFLRQLEWVREAGVLEPELANDLVARASVHYQQLEAKRRAAAAGPPVWGDSEDRSAACRETGLASGCRARRVAGAVGAGVGAGGCPGGAAPAAVVLTEAKPLPPPPPPRPPRKPWMEMLAEFLEERNIRFAELIGVFVGGLLIVGSSLALVITFWQQLQAEQLQYLKFSIFVAGCAAVFGIGLYAFHRWKLDATGRGILVIATLLVPLDFLGMALMSGESLDPWPLAVGLVGLMIFMYLVGLAARALLPENFWLLILAVVGNSAAVFLTPPLVALVARAVGPDAMALAIGAMGALPVAVFCGAMGGYLYRLPKKEDLDWRRSSGLFVFLGTAVFALAAALGLLVTKGAEAHGSLAVALQSAAPLFALAAVPVLAAGLAVMRGTERDESLAGYRTAGTAVALVGLSGMVAALAIAWPWSWGVIAVGLFNAAAMAFVAFRRRLPVAHAGAIASAAIVYLMGFLVATGDLPWQPGVGAGREVFSLLLSSRSGLAMVGLAVALAAVGEGLARLGRREHAIQYAGGSAVVGLLSFPRRHTTVSKQSPTPWTRSSSTECTG